MLLHGFAREMLGLLGFNRFVISSWDQTTKQGILFFQIFLILTFNKLNTGPKQFYFLSLTFEKEFMINSFKIVES